MHHVSLRLSRPPIVANAGAAIHGTTTHTDTFLLPDLWQLHLYAYDAELTAGTATHVIRPGHVSLLPPGKPVTFTYQGRSEHLFAHFRVPNSGSAQQIPVMQDAGPQAAQIGEMLRRAISAPPAHASAEVWAVLWRIAQLPAAHKSSSLAVLRAKEFIEARLSEPITVPQIARHAEVSHNSLTRLFQTETGGTVVAYIRERRLARAAHLLRRTTLPIPAVAAATGIPDLQAFNKACRRELGASPRAIRSSQR